MRFVLLIYVFLSSAAQAQNTAVQTAEFANEMLEQASQSLANADSAADRIAALTRIIRAYEEGLSALRQGLRQAAIQERRIMASFEVEQDRLSRLLGVLQTIDKSPAPLLLIHPSGPVGTARSAMILSDVAPAIQADAEKLRLQLEQIAILRSLQENAETTVTTSLAQVQTARSELAKAVADRTDLPGKFTSDPDQLRSLLESSDTLLGFATGLGQLGSTASQNDFATAKGQLTLPAHGTVLRRFNEADAAGIKRPGILLATQSATLVTAPWPATIRYLGPFLNYGNVVILEPAKDNLLILAGLHQVLGQPGDIVSKGTPIGFMGGLAQNTDAFLIDAVKGGGSNLQESLYIEIRQDGEPVDPATWFNLDRE